MERNHRDSMERNPRSPPGKKQIHNGEGKKNQRHYGLWREAPDTLLKESPEAHEIRLKQPDTCTSSAKLALSSGRPPWPAWPGYSQSMSRPSKLCSRSQLMAELTNCWRLAEVADMALNPSERAVNPPTASKVFSPGLFSFRSLKRL